MKKFVLHGKSVRTLSFEESGIYNTGWENGTSIAYYECEDSEIETLKTNLKNVTFPDIKDGDSLFFAKGAVFPKLLLSRLDLSVKRTIKIDKANKVIINKKNLVTQDDLDKEKGYVILFDETKDEDGEYDFSQIFYITDSNLESSKITLELAQRYFPGTWHRAIKISGDVTDTITELVNTKGSLMTSVEKLACYLNSKLPSLDDTTSSTMLALIKSSDIEQKKLGINMLTQFNLSNILYDFVVSMGTSNTRFDQNTRNSVNFKYLMLLIGCSATEIEDGLRYGWRNRHIYAKLFKCEILNPEQKFKAWCEFAKEVIGQRDYNKRPISKYEMSAFDQYGMPYSYDPQRETANSNSEVEGS